MSGPARDTSVVSLSVRFYELLLVVYPQEFRNEYGRHMLQVFRDCCLRIHKEEGFIGLLSLWALTLHDWLRSVVEQHMEKETLVTRNTLIRLSGWAMIIGGIASALGLIGLILREPYYLRISGVWEAMLVIAFFYGPLGVGLGLLGLRARYGEAIGVMGKSAMLLGAVGGVVLVFIGDLVQSLPNSLADNGFGIFMVGYLMLFITLELYGVVAIIRKPQERGNGLAVMAGLPVTILAVLMATIRGEPRSLPIGMAVLFISLFTLMGISLAMLGYQLERGIREQVSAGFEGA